MTTHLVDVNLKCSPAREPDAPEKSSGTVIPLLLHVLACDKGLHHEHAHAMVQGMVEWAEPHHGGDDMSDKDRYFPVTSRDVIKCSV